MYQRFFKRFLDILISLAAMPVLLLVLLVLAPMIHFSDGGPVFYRAVRLGKDRRQFGIYKLRSMAVNAPDMRNADGSTYTGADDPRVTKLGRFLRRTSIDELPQLLNVLLGDMSLIGPRPTVPSPGVTLADLDETRRKHYAVRPGITGYSQAYFRNAATQAEKYGHDAYYADHVSFLLDVKILCRTVLCVLRRENIHAPAGEVHK